MNFTSVKPWWSRQMLFNILSGVDGVKSTPFMIDPVTLHMFMGQQPLNIDTDVATLVANECTFTGYAAITIVRPFQGPVRLSQGVQGKMFQASFIAANPITQTGPAAGYWVASAGVLCLAENFPSPFQFANPQDYLDLNILFPMSGNQASQ